MTTIRLTAATTRKPEWAMAQPVDFALETGEHIAIVGPNAAGKSMFIDMITGRHPVFPGMAEYHFPSSPYGGDKKGAYENISYITFRDTYGGDNDRTYFLQQRWNQMEIDEETPTVGDKLEEAYRLAGDDTPERRQLQQHLYSLFHIAPLLDKHVILLSSGELRKFKLASSLFGSPRVLIIDNPFIGLDAETRSQLVDLLASLAAQQQLQLILVLSRTDEIPDFMTHVVPVAGMTVLPKLTRAEFLSSLSPTLPPSPATQPERSRQQPTDSQTQEVITFTDVTIRYGSRTILSHLNWQVNKGEHWVLSGQNGSGKSTLLSLVCADNPQAYACDIALFGHRRGSGESIWDIKRRIGYVSPEMHRSYHRDIPALRIVASGLKDSVGLYVRPTADEKQACHHWMSVFGIDHLADRSFLHMSSGEQRLVLLARAFVKDPELLILDEPLHGLDNANRQLVKQVIDDFCQHPDKTLIFVSHYREERPACIDHELTLCRH